jgi:hypothetical protein
MRSKCCLCPPHQQARLVEPEDTAIARQRLSEHVPATTNTHATTEVLLDEMFSMWFVLCQILNT